jgi:kynurenine formamidase
MFDKYRVVDLTRPINTDMPTFPAILKTYLGVYKGHKETVRPDGRSWQANILVIGDHAGTHIDAPLHFNPDGIGIDRMPVDLMIGNAVMQDYSYKKSGEPVTTAEIEGNLVRIGVEPKQLKFLLFRTGAAALYGTDAYMRHYLEIKVEAVEWMLDRDIAVFGVDASTVDHASDRATHLLMRKRTCYHIENLANLENLPTDRMFGFFCAPLILENASASPLRALALVEKL